MTINLSQVDEISDRDLERRVTGFLVARDVPGVGRLKIQARQGVVTLCGTLQSFYQRQLSTHFASRVVGVVKVIDQIEVAWPSAK